MIDRDNQFLISLSWFVSCFCSVVVKAATLKSMSLCVSVSRWSSLLVLVAADIKLTSKITGLNWTRKKIQWHPAVVPQPLTTYHSCRCTDYDSTFVRCAGITLCAVVKCMKLWYLKPVFKCCMQPYLLITSSWAPPKPHVDRLRNALWYQWNLAG